MNAFAATRLLRATSRDSPDAEELATLGRDIRTSPEKIARYCVMAYEPIYEDLATLVESTRPKDRYGRHGCGICGVCLLRTVAAHAAGLPIGDNAFDVYAPDDIAVHGDGRRSRMRPGERAVVVRAIAAMAWFASLATSPSGTLTIQREARLIDPAEPLVPETRLRRLLKQHQSEWNAFMSSLPQRSWVREIVVQL